MPSVNAMSAPLPANKEDRDRKYHPNKKHDHNRGGDDPAPPPQQPTTPSPPLEPNSQLHRPSDDRLVGANKIHIPDIPALGFPSDASLNLTISHFLRSSKYVGDWVLAAYAVAIKASRDHLRQIHHSPPTSHIPPSHRINL